MYVVETNSFKKDFKKLNKERKEKVRIALDLFITEPSNLKLKYHALHGTQIGQFAISADYDLRIIFRYLNGRVIVVLISVGTHDQVYI